MPERLQADLSANLDAMDAILSRKLNADMACRLFRVFRRDAAVYYVDGMVSGEYLQRLLLAPCLAHCDNDLPGCDLPEKLLSVVPLSEVTQVSLADDAAAQMMDGKAVVLIDGSSTALCFDIRAYVRRSIGTPLTESVVNGPHEGFNESLRDNVTLIRRILRTPKLIGEMLTVGNEMPTGISMLYLKDIADEEIVSRIRRRVTSLQVDHVLSIGALQQLIEDRPSSMLPQCCLTERPDRAASFLLEGQIVLVMDGSPQVLAAPISFLHLFHTPDDTSMRWQTGTFLRLLRLFGALCTLLLPGVFVASVIYHPEILPVSLLTSVMEAQAAVPFSIPVEMVLMLVMFNLISEAATRVPGVVGSSLGTVSGLILGQAAVEARLIHPLLIIVVAVASLGSYAIPDYALSLSFRIGQLALVVIGCILGFFGITLTGTACFVRLCSMRSFGAPYTAPLAPWRSHNPDIVIRWPIWRQRLRTYLSSPESGLRAHGRMRRWEEDDRADH